MAKINHHYDVIIVGLGAMGSAALYRLACKGISVLGIDQFNPPHIFGSSHGETRVTRLANGEGEEYTKLALHARVLWKELEKISGESLLVENTGLIFGNSIKNVSKFESQNFLTETINQAKRYNINHSILSAEEILKKYPQFKLTGDEIGYMEPTAGFLFPEKCIRVQLNLALQAGAHKLSEVFVNDIKFDAKPIVVSTTKGSFTCEKIIVSSGAWISKILPEFQDKFTIYRQIAVWFKLKGSISHYLPNQFPTFKWKFLDGNVTGIYGFPIIDPANPSIKIGIEDYSQKIDVQEHNPEVNQKTVNDIYEKYISHRIPVVAPEYQKATACIYTVTNDWKFIFDFHPSNKNVIIASPCSGHGFKHSSAIGEILANMSTNTHNSFDLQPFAINKFKTKS